MNKNLDDKMYLLYHYYEYGENNENEEIKILGIYNSEQEASKAIERYYKLEGFKKYPKECFVVSEYHVNEDTGWKAGFVSSDDLEQNFETLTAYFNEWLCNNKSPHESWENDVYYNALCDVEKAMYKIKEVRELAEYIQQVWIRRFNDKSKSFDEYAQIASKIILRGFYNSDDSYER